MIRKAKRLTQSRQRPTIYVDGATSRDSTYVEDFLRAIIAAGYSHATTE